MTHEWLMKDDKKGGDAVATTEFVREVVKEKIETELSAELDPKDTEGKAKLDGVTDVQTMSRLAAGKDKMDRAMVYHATKVVQDGSHQYSPGEADGIFDWLAEALDESQTKSSEWYDLSFIAGQLVPYMLANGVPNAAVMWASGYRRKARSSVPMLRHLFKQAPKNLPDRVKEVTAHITDPKMSKRDIEQEWREEKGITTIIAAVGKEQIQPDGITRLTIECDEVQLGAIKKKLKGLVDFQVDTKVIGI